ncbi:MAG: PucR family transcriptional regulator ligand-binding domain-containing protein [Atribacterota bacterium]|jgi:predicted transcriptional regulator|nr:PucR family transcriptional regulator ligand-binding domain-containing protein [Atribacterota bacterium]
MKIKEIVDILDAEVLSGEDSLDREIEQFAASDLLSDVLALSRENFLLLTGLTSQQVVRTAEIAGGIGVVFVRGKAPEQEAIGLANSHNIPLLMTSKTMFDSCRSIVEAIIKKEKK